THQWACALDSGNSVRTLFVDYSKAFDRVDHTLLLRKMKDLGIPHCLLRWVFSFLQDRFQRVKVNQFFSEWIRLSAGMPQGTWIGPLSFVILIDNLKLQCHVVKFVDDTTVSEIYNPVTTPSLLPAHALDLHHWSTDNFMLVNFSKTKEMLLGGINNNPPDPLAIDGHTIDRVTSFKLLGLHIANDLRWDIHIDALCSKVNSKLYFLKQLKRSGLSTDDLLCFYKTVIRPVLEYACVVWHHGLTQAQSDRLEALQKRAIRIMANVTFGMPYSFGLSFCNLETLDQRRTHQGKQFFEKMCESGSCLHHLLPPKRDINLVARLRHANTYPVPLVRTNRYCSFINYALSHYQT
ncbi:MAG TPA: reverse transcriptase domain-containing protein, partial [Methylococcales bacterium]